MLRQTGIGKGDAIRLGFTRACGNILMIMDADMTVPPEDLPRFYEALHAGQGEFINGVRLVYPMEDEAMRSLTSWETNFSWPFPGFWDSRSRTLSAEQKSSGSMTTQ